MAEEPRKRLASTRKLIVIALGGVAVVSVVAGTALGFYDKEGLNELIGLATAAVAGAIALAKQEDD